VQLERVFVNLLTNGINHSPRGGKVEIVMESYASYQVVKVSGSPELVVIILSNQRSKLIRDS
jgi:signal transduction histidine kinase